MAKEQRFKPHLLMGASLIAFFRNLLAIKGGVKGEAITRLFISFFILVMFSPFRLIEWVLYLFAKKEEVVAPIFVVGHPRSGTTFVHDSMNQLENVVAPRTIDCLFPFMNKYFSFILVPILKKALPETRLMDKMKMAWDSPQEEEFGMVLMSSHSSVRFLFAPLRNVEILNKYVLMREEKATQGWLRTHKRFARKVQTINKGKRIVFKSPGNTARMKELLSTYPDAKFIHIVRDPQDVIRSTMHLYKSILPEFSLQDESKLNLEEFVFNYYESMMQKYLETKDDLKLNQLVEVKYEEFVDDPMVIMNKLLSQLELSFDVTSLKQFFDSRKNFAKNKFQNDPDFAKKIGTRCEAVINTYKYD